MDDLIRRNDALDALCFYDEKSITGRTPQDIVRVLPAVDAVEVVRCRECEEWTKQTENPGPDGLGACSFHKANLVTGEGFCYWGQRREDGNDGTT